MVSTCFSEGGIEHSCELVSPVLDSQRLKKPEIGIALGLRSFIDAIVHFGKMREFRVGRRIPIPANLGRQTRRRPQPQHCSKKFHWLTPTAERALH